MQPCKRCKEAKPELQGNRRQYCDLCLPLHEQELKTEWRHRNPNKYADQVKLYSIAHKDQIASYRANHQTEYRQYRLKYARNNPAKVGAYRREFQATHRNYVNEKNHEWREKNKGQIKEYNSRYRLILKYQILNTCKVEVLDWDHKLPLDKSFGPETKLVMKILDSNQNETRYGFDCQHTMNLFLAHEIQQIKRHPTDVSARLLFEHQETDIKKN